MAKYNLQSNEVVLLKDDNVIHGVGVSLSRHELILTNLNLVLVKKGVFGNSNGIRTYPVNQIKVYNQEAQARLGGSRYGTPLLEVYFVNGEEQFSFQNGGKKRVLEWAAKINEIVTGQTAPEVGGDSSLAIPGMEVLADMWKDTLGIFKSKRGSEPEAAIRVAAKCRACGAPVSGRQGQPITCEYCGTAQQL